MYDLREDLCRLFLADITALRTHLDRILHLVQTLSPDATRDELEKIHQSMTQRILTINQNLLGICKSESISGTGDRVFDLAQITGNI